MTEEKILESLYPEAFKKPEYIICAAIHFQDGNKYEHQPINIETGFVVCGRRHHNCYLSLAIIKNEDVSRLSFGKNIQGFLTSKDRFVDRKEAGAIAFAQGQTKKLEDCLFSEDLY